MSPCPHLQNVAHDAILQRLGSDSFQEQLRNKTLACSSCDTKSKTPDLWACLQCEHIACGRLANKHAMQHYDDTSKAHALCVNVYSRVIWCYGCNDEILEDVDSQVEGGQGKDAISDNVTLLREVRVLLDPNRQSVENEEEDEDEDEDEDSEDDHDLDDEDRSQRRNISNRGLVGLSNLGNTCYLNAALQALSNCRPLSQYYRKWQSLKEPKSAEKGDSSGRSKLVQHFADLIYQMWGGKVKSVAPQFIVRDIFAINPQFRGYGQQDSQEFLRCILNSLHDEQKIEVRPKANEDAEQTEKDKGDENSQADSQSTISVQGKTKKEPRRGKQSASSAANGDASSSDGSLANGDYRRLNGVADSKKSSSVAEAESSKKAPQPVKTASIISDVFEGSLLSEVTCQNCKKVSQKEDAVYELSVSIPGKKQRQKMQSSEKLQASAAPSGSSGGSSKEGKTGSSWFGSFTNWFGMDKNKNITLQDCLSAFCGMEELTGDDKYKCESCKMVNEATKKLTILKLPEVLVIHIKRFRYDSYFGSKLNQHVMFPLEELDMKPFLQKNAKLNQQNSKYDLFAVVNHHGMLNGGHYTAFAKNYMSNKWYEFDDAHVAPASKDDVARSEAYMLFYKKTYPVTVTRMRKRVATAIKEHRSLAAGHAKEPSVYLSSYWYHKFQSLVDPGPVSNYDFLCDHNNVNIKFSNVSIKSSPEDSNEPEQKPQIGKVPQAVLERVIKVPRSIWDLLISTYGGGPVVRDLTECSTCLDELRQLKRQRETEKKAIQESDRTYVETGESWFIIDSKWLNQWREFALEESRNTRPGPISNDRLLLPDGKPRQGLQKAKDYRGVNSKVWQIFYSTYGGGPAIPRTQLDIYSDPPGDDSEESEDASTGPDD